MAAHAGRHRDSRSSLGRSRAGPARRPSGRLPAGSWPRARTGCKCRVRDVTRASAAAAASGQAGMQKFPSASLQLTTVRVLRPTFTQSTMLTAAGCQVARCGAGTSSWQQQWRQRRHGSAAGRLGTLLHFARPLVRSRRSPEQNIAAKGLAERARVWGVGSWRRGPAWSFLSTHPRREGSEQSHQEDKQFSWLPAAAVAHAVLRLVLLHVAPCIASSPPFAVPEFKTQQRLVCAPDRLLTCGCALPSLLGAQNWQ